MLGIYDEDAADYNDDADDDNDNDDEMTPGLSTCKMLFRKKL